MKKSKGMQLGTLLTVMLLMSTAFLLVANAQPVNQNIPPTNQVTLTGKNVVYFNTSGSTPLDNSQRFIIQGNQTPAGCQYKITLHKAASEGNIYKVLRELAIDPTTCKQLVEQGTLNRPLPETIVPGIQNNTVFRFNNANTMSDSNAQASFQTTWYDPVGAGLNTVADIVNWNYNGQTVSPNYITDQTWANGGTGWFEAAHQIYPFSGVI